MLYMKEKVGGHNL